MSGSVTREVFKKLRDHDDNERAALAARLSVLAEQLQVSSAELALAVAELRKEHNAKYGPRKDDRGNDDRSTK